MTKKKDERKSKMKPLEEIKRLLILGLIQSGVQSKDIAQALGVNKSTITRIAPARQIKKSPNK